MTRRVFLGLALLVLWAGSAGAAMNRNDIRFPDLPGYVTLKCDLHMHTVFSDGAVWPTVRVDEAWREGLNAIALSDHLDHHNKAPDVVADNDRPCDIALKRASELGILLIRGGEIAREPLTGHYNTIYLTKANDLQQGDSLQALALAAEQKAFAFWNHPGSRRPDDARWGQNQAKVVDRKQLQGVEVCNGPAYFPDAHRFAIEHKLTLVGNSDMHSPSPYCQRTPEDHRTITLVFAKSRDLDSLKEALQVGRTAVWCGNKLIANEPYLSALFAGSVTVRRVGGRLATGLVMAEVENRSELDIELVKEGADTTDARTKLQATVKLPAGVTAMVPMNVPAGKTGRVELSYQATNFLVGPNEPLKVKLVVNVPTTAPAGQ